MKIKRIISSIVAAAMMLSTTVFAATTYDYDVVLDPVVYTPGAETVTVTVTSNIENTNIDQFSLIQVHFTENFTLNEELSSTQSAEWGCAADTDDEGGYVMIDATAAPTTLSKGTVATLVFDVIDPEAVEGAEFRLYDAGILLTADEFMTEFNIPDHSQYAELEQTEEPEEPAEDPTAKLGRYVMNTNTVTLAGDNWTEDMMTYNFVEPTTLDKRNGDYGLLINVEEEALPGGHYIDVKFPRNDVASVGNGYGRVSQKIRFYSKSTADEMANVTITPAHDWGQRVSVKDGFVQSGPDANGWYTFEKTYYGVEMATVEFVIVGRVNDVIIDDVELVCCDLDVTGNELTGTQLANGTFEDTTDLLAPPAEDPTAKDGRYVMNTNTVEYVGDAWTDELKTYNFVEPTTSDKRNGEYGLLINVEEETLNGYIDVKFPRNDVASVGNSYGRISQKVRIHTKAEPEELMNVTVTPQHDWGQRVAIGNGFVKSGPDANGWYIYEKTYYGLEMGVLEFVIVGRVNDVIIDDVELVCCDLDVTGNELTGTQLANGTFEDVTDTQAPPAPVVDYKVEIDGVTYHYSTEMTETVTADTVVAITRTNDAGEETKEFNLPSKLNISGETELTMIFAVKVTDPVDSDAFAFEIK